jgi:hypothetical protein
MPIGGKRWIDERNGIAKFGAWVAISAREKAEKKTEFEREGQVRREWDAGLMVQS